jgi:hypothetical protein
LKTFACDQVQLARKLSPKNAEHGAGIPILLVGIPPPGSQWLAEFVLSNV